MVGDAAMRRHDTAGMDATVTVAHGQRGTLSFRGIPLRESDRQGLPVDLIGGEPHDQGDLRGAGVFGDLHPRHEQPRGPAHPESCVELVGGHGDRDVPGAGGPVSGISGAPGDLGQGVGAALPGLRVSSGPVGAAYSRTPRPVRFTGGGVNSR